MPEVVFLPGFMQHADSWSPVAAAVGERYPSKVVEFETWELESRLDEIGAAAAPGSVLVGYSMGGRLALHAAVREPDRYRGLALLGASAGIEDRDERRLRREADSELADWIESQPITAVVDRWERNPVFASQSTDVVAAQRPGRLRHSPADLARLLRSAGQGACPAIWDRLDLLEIPVLALAGENDRNYREASRRIASLVPRGETVAIAGAGHAAHLERPAAVAEALIAWISRRLFT